MDDDRLVRRNLVVYSKFRTKPDDIVIVWLYYFYDVKFDLNNVDLYLIIIIEIYFRIMVLQVKFVLFIFITFLSTPTIVSLIKRSFDTSVFYSMSEEEQVYKEIKEVKAELKHATFDLIIFPKLASLIVITENQLKHDNVSTVIFSPPPNI